LARKPRQQIDWFDDPSLAEVPNPKSSWVAKALRRQRLFRRIIVIDVIVAPLILLLIFGTLFGSSATSASSSAAGTVLDSPLVYQGEVNVQQWLDAKPAPLPGGTLVSYYGQTPAPVPAKPSTDPTTVADYHIVSFVVVAHNVFYKVSIEEQLNGQSASVVSVAPSITPLGSADNASSSTQSPWSGISVNTAPPSTTFSQAVQGWAEAYTSGSPGSLALAVGDPNSSDHYVPLSGVSQVQSNVVYYASLTPTTAIAEVDLTITWAGQTKSPQSANYVYDVLVERPLSAAPVVVAWGPPGSGPSLVPYQNAVK
jgi:hypothetical protein